MTCRYRFLQPFLLHQNKKNRSKNKSKMMNCIPLMLMFLDWYCCLLDRLWFLPSLFSMLFHHQIKSWLSTFRKALKSVYSHSPWFPPDQLQLLSLASCLINFDYITFLLTIASALCFCNAFPTSWFVDINFSKNIWVLYYFLNAIIKKSENNTCWQHCGKRLTDC